MKINVIFTRNRAIRSESEMVWYFIIVYTVNETLDGRLQMRNFSSCVEKYFTRSLHSFVKYLSTHEETFRISEGPCKILYFLYSLRRWWYCKRTRNKVLAAKPRGEWGERL